jgi:hypothetical protein
MDIKKYSIDKMKHRLAIELIEKLDVKEEQTPDGIKLSLDVYVLDEKTYDYIFTQLKVMNDYINNYIAERINNKT